MQSHWLSLSVLVTKSYNVLSSEQTRCHVISERKRLFRLALYEGRTSIPARLWKHLYFESIWLEREDRVVSGNPGIFAATRAGAGLWLELESEYARPVRQGSALHQGAKYMLLFSRENLTLEGRRSLKLVLVS